MNQLKLTKSGLEELENEQKMNKKYLRLNWKLTTCYLGVN